MELLANKWNAFSEGPLTKRVQSLEDYNEYARQLANGYVDMTFSGPEDIEKQFERWEHKQVAVLQRMPTFDESWDWLEQMSARSEQSRRAGRLIKTVHC